MRDYLRPIESTQNILNSYKDYIISTFHTSNAQYNEQIEDLVMNKHEFVKGPYFQLTENYKKGKSIRELTDSFLSKEFLKLDSKRFSPDMQLFEHQIAALSNIIVNDRSTVVSTGTGSGKTESFLFPIFNHLMREIESGSILQKGVRAMLIYPMNALVNDQIGRLKDLLENYPGITFGFFTGETADLKDNASYEKRFGVPPSPNEVFIRKEMRSSPPHILITNYAMLEHILIRPENSVEIFNPNSSNLWKYIVLDEAHSYGGAKGAEVSMLMRRIKATLNNNNIRFILTSATLGDETTNDKVADFANNLTGSFDIDAGDVIRAVTDPPNKPDLIEEVPIEFYRKVLSSNFDPLVIQERSGLHETAEALGDIVLSDARLWRVRESLLDGVKPLAQVCEETKISEDNLVDFVNVATKAKKHGNRVFDAKYNVFMRSMDGVYITLAPSNKVSFDCCKTIRDSSQNDEEFVVFQMSACYNCNAIFIPGKEIDGFLNQISDSSIIDVDGTASDALYMLSSKDDYDDMHEDSITFYHLCSKCGRLTPYHSAQKCSCGPTYHNVVRKVIDYDEKEKLCKCPNCEQVNTKFGIVRDFYLGSEAASSVIASSLFMQIPEPSIEEDKIRQFLLFSDSRKSASYAAVNLDKTHENILMHRIIYEVISRHSAEFEHGITYGKLLEYITDMTAHVYNATTRNEMDECSNIAKRALFREFAGTGSNKSLEYFGLFRFASDVDYVFPGLSAEETFNLVNQCLKIIREKGYVRSDNIRFEDLEEMFHGSRTVIKRRVDGSSSDSVFETATVKRYLDKIFEGDEKKRMKFVDELFKLLEMVKGGKYNLKADTQHVEPQLNYYFCTHCKKKTPYSVKNICPRCLNESLSEHKSDFLTNPDHYAKQYRSMPMIPLKVKEHTAQLNKALLSEYQKDFVDQKYNALSCSTTFEMGIDIGSLSTIFLRNVPPAPSNYIQRAGRAGRSVDSSAFIVTFCKNSSHDQYYFSHPEEMICGKVMTPIVNVDNPKIAIRHIFASGIGYYWKSEGSSPNDVSDLMSADYLQRLKDFFTTPPGPLKSYLKTIVPSPIQEYISDDVSIGLSTNAWVDCLIGEMGRLSILVDEYNNDLERLETLFTECTQDKERRGSLTFIQRTINTICEEDTLSYLSRGNVIPKYGFPVETIKLEPVSAYRNKSMEFDLQRELSLGIGEYAPGCQIVANGKLITSYNIKVVRGKEWDKYAFVKCPTCSTMSLERFVTKDADYPESIRCTNCKEGNILTTKRNCFLVPKFGFQFRDDNVARATINKPRLSRGRTIEYKGNQNRNPERFNLKRLSGTLEHNKDDELIAYSNDEYLICESCGYGVKLSNDKNRIHKLPWSDATCANKALKAYHLGYTLRTDVTIIHFDDESNLDENGHRSVLYALIEGLTLAFNIERNEIDGCLRSNGKGSYDYVLFDNTPGGAGYVKTLDLSNMSAMISKSTEMLSNCSCGGLEGKSSCYGCLRNYRNQKFHDILDRGVALQYLKHIEELIRDV